MRYELMFILNPKQTEQKIKAQMDELRSALAEHDFSIVDEDVWGQRPLAYKIRGLSEGYYVVLLFEGEPANMPALQRDLRLQSALVRFMTLKVPQSHVLLRYDNALKAAKKLSKHAEELNKKVAGKMDTLDESASPEDLDEKLQAIIDDKDIDL